MQPSEFKKVYKSYVTLVEMLKDRKYDEINTLTFEEFEEEYDGDEDVARKKLVVKACKNKNFDTLVLWKMGMGKDDITEILDKMSEESIKKCIVIHVLNVTPNTKAIIRNFRTSKKIKIETFTQEEMQYNPTKHVDVPRHIICSVEMKETILETYNTTEDKLPAIRKEDPIARYYGMVKGQLVKILRPSEAFCSFDHENKTFVPYDVTYRIVI